MEPGLSSPHATPPAPPPNGGDASGQQDPDGKILINGDEEATFSQAVYVFDEVRKAGFEKVWIETRVKAADAAAVE